MMKRFYILFICVIQMAFAFGQQEPSDYLRGRAMMSLEKYDSALIFFSRAIKDDPGDIDAREYRAMVNFELGNYSESIEDFLVVDKRFPGRASLMLAKTETRLGHDGLAINYLREHLNSNYKVPESELLLDQDLSSLENSSAWRQLWNEDEWYKPFEKDLQEAVYMMNNGNSLEALNRLNKLKKQGRFRSELYGYEAEIYHASGNEKAAIEALEKSLKSDSRNTSALKLRISMASASGDYEQVYQDCNTLLRQDPGMFRYYLVKAMASSKLNRPHEGITTIDNYLELFPGSDTAYYLKARIYNDHGQYLNALRAINQAMELNDQEAAYFGTRGEIYGATKMHNYAVKDLGMALDLDNENAEYWFLKGKSELALGNDNRACFDFKNATRYGKFEAREYVERICGSAE